jgi:hypothetical protein
MDGSKIVINLQKEYLYRFSWSEWRIKYRDEKASELIQGEFLDLTYEKSH